MSDQTPLPIRDGADHTMHVYIDRDTLRMEPTCHAPLTAPCRDDQPLTCSIVECLLEPGDVAALFDPTSTPDGELAVRDGMAIEAWWDGDGMRWKAVAG